MPTYESKFADEYAVLIMNNLHDSLKWVFTIVMGGAVLQAGLILKEWLDSTWAAAADLSKLPVPSIDWIPFLLFLVFSLTFFRFYWGWVRYCDIKSIEAPRVILAFRDYLLPDLGPDRYNDAFKTALRSSGGVYVMLDAVPLFFQTMIIFLLARSLLTPILFIHMYVALMLFNALFLFVNLWMHAYHKEAFQKAHRFSPTSHHSLDLQ
jgi:hypothetical protein